MSEEPKQPKQPKQPEANEDVVLIHGRTEDGALRILRKKGEELSAGELRPMGHGKPIQGDVLKLKPRKEMPLLCDVEEEIKLAPDRKSDRKSADKPARVASEEYRDGWDKLWGRRRRASKPN